MPLINYSLPENCALGDLTGTVYLLENIGRQTDQKFKLRGPRSLINLLSVFRLEYVSDGADNPISLLRIKKNYSAHFLPNLLVGLKSLYSVNWRAFKSLPAQQVRTPGKQVAVQFDSKSAKRYGRLYDPHWLVHSWKDPVVVVGGPDTSNYLSGYPYRREPLPELGFSLLEYQAFMGCDSGLSHLAGALGMNTIVIPPDSHDILRTMYELYSRCVVWSYACVKYGKIL